MVGGCVINEVYLENFIIFIFWQGGEGGDFKIVKFVMQDDVGNVGNSVGIIDGGSVVCEQFDVVDYYVWDEIEVRCDWCVMNI